MKFKTHSASAEILRRKAEELLKKMSSKKKESVISEADTLKLIHELQVHQIELELVNEELILAKQQEELAREKYTSLFDFAPTAYFTLKSGGKIAELNLTAAKMLGKDRRSLINKSLAIFITTDSRDTFEDFLSKTVGGKSLQSCEVYFGANGCKLLCAHMSGAIAEDGIHCLITAVDISEHKQTEDKLKESEFQYWKLANSGSALIWKSGTDKLCNYFNETWLRFTGRTLEQEMGNGWAEGVHPDDLDRCLETYVTSFDKHEPFEMEYRLRHASGEYKWLLDLGTPNLTAEGNLSDISGIASTLRSAKRLN